MPFDVPIAALSDRGFFQKDFTVPDGIQTELNLYEFFGSPTGPSDVFVTFESIEVRTLFIGDWANGTVVNITGTSSMQFRGRGGNGGNGGESFFEGLLGGCLGFGGNPGQAGSAAIILPGTGVTLNFDGDDCFVWGGGGGGGGGGVKFSGGDCVSGCGGGGAQGWDTNAGGTGFFSTCNGAAGGPAGPGSGGTNTDPDGGDGGDGGTWGTAGDGGTDGADGGGASGGLGGRAIQQPAGDTVNITGTKNQATLESEGRLLGRNGDPIGA